MNEEKRYEQIQNYLSGALTTTELKDFEKALAEDPQLQEEVDLHLLADDAIELVIEDDLRSELQTLAQENKKKKSVTGGRVVSMRRRIYSLSIAASILLVIGFVGAMFQGNRYGNDSLADAYYENDLISRVRGANSESLLKEGMDLFTQNQYDEAINYFDRVTDPSLIAEADYAAAHAHYNLENYEAAMTNFADVIDSKDPRFQEKAELYYVLSALAADKTDDTRYNEVFDQILTDEGHFAHQQVLELNKKMKSFWRKFDF